MNMNNTENAIDVCFAFEHEYFGEPLEVWVKWGFPFLPRQGEYIGGWIWIDSEDYNEEYVMNVLTDEGLEDFKNTGRKLSDWLYDIFIGVNIVKSVSYMKKHGEEIYVMIFVGADDTAKKEKAAKLLRIKNLADEIVSYLD
jgi:hypothetical protein